LLPDMKKKKAVRNSIEPRLGRGGGGAMNVPGGMGVGGASVPGVTRGDRGDVGAAGAGAFESTGIPPGGTGSDMAPKRCILSDCKVYEEYQQWN
jgi:hypothetical protein